MEVYTPVKTASSWNSYRNTLLKVLTVFQPLSVLEYGPGESTRIMQKWPSVTLIDTIEHDIAWADKIKPELNHKVKLVNTYNHYYYPYVQGRVDKYDLIFVDGIERPNCLALAQFRVQRDGMVVLHDAERQEYKEAIERWPFKFFQDDGHTVVLTMNKDTAIKLSEIL